VWAASAGTWRGRRPGEVCGLKEKREGEKNWAGWKRRERGEGVKAFSFFKKSFQIRFFQTSIKQKSMHSNHDAQTLIISKLF
jgi:hypothetical protein